MENYMWYVVYSLNEHYKEFWNGDKPSCFELRFDYDQQHPF